MTWSIQEFCGLPSNGSYVVYVDTDKTFGRCFLWTAFSYISHIIFAVVCAYFLGISRKFTSTRRSWLAVASCAVALLSALCPIVELILSYSLHHRQQHPPAYVLARTIALTSWLLCFLLQWQTNAITKDKKESNKIVLVVFVLILLSSCMQLQYVDQNIDLKNISAGDIPVDYVGVLVSFSLNLLFFILCIGISLSRKVVRAHAHTLPDESKETVMQLGQAESTTNILSKLVYWWADRLLRKGFKRQLNEPSDLFSLPVNLETERMKEVLMENLKKEKEKLLDNLKADGVEMTEKTSVRISMFNVLNQCFGKVFYSIAVFKFLANALQLIQPELVNLLVTFVSDKNEPVVHGYYYALAFLVSTLLSVICDLHYRYNMKKCNLRVRAALISAIYQKTLSVRASSLNQFSTGKIVNLMSTDTDRVRGYCDNFHECWSVPFQLIVCLYLLYQQIGAAFLPAIVYCILVLPVAQRLSKKIKDNQMNVLGQRDQRIKTICEILFGIRIIKYNVWEKHFIEGVKAIRNRELKFSLMIKFLIAGVICIWGMTVSIMLLLSIGTYVLLGYQLTAAKVFTVMAVIDRLVSPLNSFSWNMNALIDAWVSLQRIESFLALPEIHLGQYYKNRGTEVDDLDVKLEGGEFRWNLDHETKLGKSDSGEKSCSSCCQKTKVAAIDSPNDDDKETINPFHLKNISVNIRTGQLVGITGKVGSGKSSLFASITAEMQKYGGSVYLSHKLDSNGIAIFTQDPWIQHLSIKDNILFGCDYDEERYEGVIHACALQEDMKLFPAGDLTEVGENGVNLSGGQKARISLARAVYQDKDIYLLDDPIAAVDAHVAKHIFKYCIMGLLKDKTRVLCTHHTSYLHQSDHVILLEDGEVAAQGPPEEVLKDIIGIVDHEDDTENEIGETDEGTNDDFAKAAKESKLIEAEEKRVGTVAFKVYKLYWSSFGNTFASYVVFATIFRQAGKNFQDWWLSHWVTETGSNSNNGTTVLYNFPTKYDNHQFFQSSIPDNAEYYLSIYGYIILGYLFFVSTGAFMHALGAVRASRVLHNSLLTAVMSTPVSFFDVTPVGRIVNRFSTDISDIDGSLPFLLQIFMRQVTSLLGSIILTCISLPWFTALLVPLGLMYYWIQLVYRRSSRELKRIGSVARSPIYEHFTETLSGYMTIRAFRETNNFIAANQMKLDRSQRAEYNEQLASLWLTFRLDLIGVIMVTAISLLAVLEHQFGTDNAGMVGLAITYSIQITPILGYMLTMFTETEKQMVRVERVGQYLDGTPRETEKSKDVPPLWPDCGNIQFDSVYLRYRENLPFALKDISFEIKSGEKIGVCGRTGSGKSTLLKVLFSIVDISGGRINIDNVNISDVDHSILRSRMSIIPQDPFLFDDTISKNLDPTGSFSSYEMLDVLEKCHLNKFVRDLGGLEGKVGEKGNNLSAGQKQLMCLARALLKKSKIICIDEATASVDLETDKLIQVTIREEFVESTVLTIAHRMNTIIDSDRILVMNAGNVQEFASPQELLADETSEFYSLVNENSSTK